MGNSSLKLVVVSISSMAVGGGIGYLVTKRYLETKYQKLAAKDIAELRAFWSEKIDEINSAKKEYNSALKEYQGDAVPSPEEMVAARGLESAAVPRTEANQKVPYHKVRSGEAEAAAVIANVFNPPKTPVDFDYEAEIAERSPEKPYIISKEEFFDNEQGFEQATLTYFEGDGALSDARDDQIEDIQATVGEDNVVRFGHRSEDNNVVYIRNERIGVDFEILRSFGKYSVEVAGLTP